MVPAMPYLLFRSHTKYVGNVRLFFLLDSPFFNSKLPTLHLSRFLYKHDPPKANSKVTVYVKYTLYKYILFICVVKYEVHLTFIIILKFVLGVHVLLYTYAETANAVHTMLNIQSSYNDNK